MSRTKPSTPARLPAKLPALAPDDALEMLASAINYCQAAGLQVSAGNRGGALVLAIHGAQLDRADGRVKFMPDSGVASTDDLPAPAPITLPMDTDESLLSARPVRSRL